MERSIERTIVIKAPKVNVWEALVDGTELGEWFGNGAPTKIDPKLGGTIVFDHGSHGDIPATIEVFDQLESFAFRWAVIGPAGTWPTESNSTVVRFDLADAEGGTEVAMVEQDFTTVDAPVDEMEQRYAANDAGWDRILEGFAAHVEQ